MDTLKGAPTPLIGKNKLASHIARSLMGCLGTFLLVACGGGGAGGGGGVGSGGNGTSAPPTIAYPSVPAYFLRGAAITPLSPTVTGTVASYSVSPSLPSGLALNISTGVISGTPTDVSAPTAYTIQATNSQGLSGNASISLATQTGPTFQISVTATPAVNGRALSYQWQSTDGVVQNVNAAETTWIAPSGPGLHFVYVVVSDGFGGYAEGRIILNTDNTGAPIFIPPVTPYQAPVQSGGNNPGNYYVFTPFNTLATNTGLKDQKFPGAINAAGITVTLNDATAGTAQQGITDSKGMVVFGAAPARTDSVTFTCSVGGATAKPCAGTNSVYAPGLSLAQSSTSSYGHVALNDGSFPGIQEPFFNLNSVAQAEVVGCAQPPCPTMTINDFGDFALPFVAQAGLQVDVSLESASTQVTLPSDANSLANGVDLGLIQIGATGAPIISSITATLNGATVGTFQNVLPVPNSGAPADNVNQPDMFLSYLGHDSRLSACMYYQAIGAVITGSCDSQGHYVGGVSFDEWQKTVQIDGYAPAGAPPTIQASFVNAVDLNLTRVHHSIAYTAPAPAHVAAYVCNHLGPADANGSAITVNLPASTITGPQRQAVDTAVANANSNKNLVACVAMDYMQSPSVNGGKPFTRFLIFGPSGELLPSVNLDGRGEKFVPGACIACHGGDKYAGKFPENGSGAPDVGGHFLPYDTGNLAFSSVAPFRQQDQELAIYHLNQNILSTNVPVNTVNLFNGWYGSGTTLNQGYVPSSWTNPLNVADPALSAQMYLNVIARNCRTCHSAIASVNLDDPIYAMTAVPNLCGQAIVGGYLGNRAQDFTMPNALVTFNRFWGSQGATAPGVDQPALTTQFFNSMLAESGTSIKPCQLFPVL